MEYDRPKDRGRALAGFPYDHLLNGLVYISHYGTIETCLFDLIAQDQELAQSNHVTIHIETYWPTVDLVFLTGINTLRFGSTLIMPTNLSFKTNVEDDNAFVVYTITDLPTCGQIELQNKVDGKWVQCVSFRQEDIDEHRLRYTYNDRVGIDCTNDQFVFNVSLMTSGSDSQQRNTSTFTFHINFVTADIRIYNAKPFLMQNVLNQTLQRYHLFSWIHTKEASATFKITDPVYQITKAPSYGTLFKIIDRQGRSRKLGQNMNFTQADIDQDKIFYKMRYEHYTVVNDEFRYKVWTPYVVSEINVFKITYLPGKNFIKSFQV